MSIRASMGLTELACDESAGVIFVCLTPGKTFDSAVAG
ncbi:MAG: hypothetical protein CM15mP125_2650 [Gammaproteobacteria bacterium]|nr:MAG: hypothetical protein CM15mP125_2650 [Gammaproteobacteria bacterium]